MLDEQGSEGLGRPDSRSRATQSSARVTGKADEAPSRHEGLEFEKLVDDTRGWKTKMMHIGEQANKFAQHGGEISEEDFERTKSKCDYTGSPIEADRSSMDPPLPFPWVPRVEVKATENAGLRRLDQEIGLFAQYATLDRAEQSGRRCVRNDVLAVFEQSLGKEATCVLFGSDRTGLATMTSDLDFRVHLRKETRTGRSREDADETMLSAMRLLEERLARRQRWIAVVLRAARFPIINAQHRDSGLDVQIVASPTTSPQLAATRHYLQRIPTLRPLFLVVKTMLGVRGLVDVLTGGTGSYGLLMMLVASLTRGPIPPDPAAQLLHFLDFYCTHDFTRNGIAIAPTPPPTHKGPQPEQHAHEPLIPKTTLFRKHDPAAIPRARYIRAAYARSDPRRAGQWSIGQRRPLQPYLPCFQDPANPLNDLGRKMNAIRHIVATFDAVRTELRARMQAAEEGRLEKGSSVLEAAVGRCHELYSERRERVREVGRERSARMAMKGRGEHVLGERESEAWEYKSFLLGAEGEDEGGGAGEVGADGDEG